MSKAQRRKPSKSGHFLQDTEPSKKKKLCQKWFRNECPREESKCRYYHGSFPCKFHHLTGYCKFEDGCRYSHGGALSLHMKNVLVDHVFTDPDEFVRPFKRRSREDLWDKLGSEDFHDQANDTREKEVPAFNCVTFNNNGRGDTDGTIFYVTNEFAAYNMLPETNSVLMDMPTITPVGPPIQQHYDQPMETYNDFGERSSSGTSRQHRISNENKGRHLMNEGVHEKTELCRKWARPRGTCHRNESECWYYHGSFPCKFYHLGKNCKYDDKCRFTHGGPLSQHLKEVLANHIANDPDYVIGGFPKYTVDQSLERMEKNETKLWEKLKCKVDREENFQTKSERRTPENKRLDKPQGADNDSKKWKMWGSNCTTNSVGFKRKYHKDGSRDKRKQTLPADPKTIQTTENEPGNVSLEIGTTHETPTHIVTTEECTESSNHTKDSNESSNHTKDSNESSNHSKDSNESFNHTKDCDESLTSTLSTNVLNEIGKWMHSDSRFGGPGFSKIPKVIDDNRKTIANVPQSGEATNGGTSVGRDTENSHSTPESPPKIPSEGCWDFTRRPRVIRSDHFIKQTTGEKEQVIPVSSHEQSEGSAHSSSLGRNSDDTVQANQALAPEDDFYSLFTRRRKANSPDEPVFSKVRRMELEIMSVPNYTSDSKAGNAFLKIDGFSGAPPNETYRDVDLRPYLPHPEAMDGQKSSSSPCRKNDLIPVATGEKSKIPMMWNLIRIRGNFGPAYEDSCLKVTFKDALNDPRFQKHLHRFF